MNITVTDTQDVALMKDDDIRKWISLHQRSLKDETMQEYWEKIQEDLDVLMIEYNLRNPLMEISETLKGIHHELINYIKIMRLTTGVTEKRMEEIDEWKNEPNKRKGEDHGKS